MSSKAIPPPSQDPSITIVYHKNKHKINLSTNSLIDVNGCGAETYLISHIDGWDRNPCRNPLSFYSVTDFRSIQCAGGNSPQFSQACTVIIISSKKKYKN